MGSVAQPTSSVVTSSKSGVIWKQVGVRIGGLLLLSQLVHIQGKRRQSQSVGEVWASLEVCGTKPSGCCIHMAVLSILSAWDTRGAHIQGFKWTGARGPFCSALRQQVNTIYSAHSLASSSKAWDSGNPQMSSPRMLGGVFRGVLSGFLARLNVLTSWLHLVSESLLIGTSEDILFPVSILILWLLVIHYLWYQEDSKIAQLLSCSPCVMLHSPTAPVSSFWLSQSYQQYLVSLVDPCPSFRYHVFQKWSPEQL